MSVRGVRPPWGADSAQMSQPPMIPFEESVSRTTSAQLGALPPPPPQQPAGFSANEGDDGAVVYDDEDERAHYQNALPPSSLPTRHPLHPMDIESHAPHREWGGQQQLVSPLQSACVSPGAIWVIVTLLVGILCLYVWNTASSFYRARHNVHESSDYAQDYVQYDEEQ